MSSQDFFTTNEFGSVDSSEGTHYGAPRLAALVPAIDAGTLVTPLQPPAPAVTQISRPISNDPRIDALIDSETYRFNNGSPVGTPATVTLSFPDQMPTSYAGEDALEWASFSAEQQAATRAILALLQQQINVTFVEVPDSATDFGIMRFSNNRHATSSGYALMPNSTGKDTDSDTWIALGYDNGLAVGSYN